MSISTYPSLPAATAQSTARRLIQPVAAVVVIALVAVVVLVWTTAQGQDDVALKAEHRIARSAVGTLEGALARTAFDYSWWDDSVRHLVEVPDTDWADNNVGSYAADTFGIDESLVVSPHDVTTFAFLGGEVSSGVDAFELFGTGLAELVRQARDAPMEEPVAVTAYLGRNGILHLVAASAITPEYPEGDDLLRRSRAILIYTRHIDAELLAGLAGDFNLAELSLADGPPDEGASRTGLALAGPSGDAVAWLTWNPAMPGTRLFYEILPWLGLGGLVFLALLAVFYQRAQAAGARMAADARALAEREHQLAQTSKLATLGEMAAGIVHELNQPLNIIHMAAESMHRTMDRPDYRADNDDIREQFGLIAGQSTRMAEIVQNMRLFSRDDYGRKLAFDPGEAIVRAVSWLGADLKGHGIDLTIEGGDATGLVYGEVSRFEQVIINLVTNARDAIAQRNADTPTGEDVRGRILVRLTEDIASERIIVSVSDSGGGISAAHLDRVFEPFFTTKPAGKGTGLGLSISYGIIAGMDGSIYVRNGEEGAVFTLALPRLSPSERTGDGTRTVVS